MNAISRWPYISIDFDAEQREIELRVADLTKRCGKYYPFSRDHIVEAVSEMPDWGFDNFVTIEDWCIEYWRGAAEQEAEQSVLKGRP